MKLATRLFITLLSLSISSVFADSQISQYKQDLIATLLEQTSRAEQDISQQLIESYLQQITSVLQQSQPELSKAILQQITAIVETAVEQQIAEKDKFNNMVYPIYDQHFTVDELQNIIEFNKTELGKKLLKVMPIIHNQHRYTFDELSLDLAPEVNELVLEVISQ
ncbi:hypothetical protein A9Q78_08220 [Methylophaga sp. 41_12_T18]|nr:hypothetical protein A9Q78_08220 [Methylophaga sp. 41_12_T18]